MMTPKSAASGVPPSPKRIRLGVPGSHWLLSAPLKPCASTSTRAMFALSVGLPRPLRYRAKLSSQW